VSKLAKKPEVVNVYFLDQHGIRHEPTPELIKIANKQAYELLDRLSV